jgi:hypothetical protein
MEYNGSGDGVKNHIQAFPGWDFKIPMVVGDDLHAEGIRDLTIFIVYKDGSPPSLAYGGNTTVKGRENKTYHVTLVTRGERIWYGKFFVKLKQCPPGFTNSNGICVCAGTYSGEVYCDWRAKEAYLSQGQWMTRINGSYYITQCPLNFCVKNDNRSILLPQNGSSLCLNSVLCGPNRTGNVCGECVEGYGPAVNSRTYECVYCPSNKLGANIAKYIASIYLPLALLFIVLILFDIRLTTGPANAFILYCQVVSSTFSLDAGGDIPLNKVVNHSSRYVEAYTFPYGIFNLEFIENLLPPICLSANQNYRTALCLDYCVAFFPIIMIALVLTVLKLKERCIVSTRRISRIRSAHFIILKTRSISEALIPAFASFILLSYTKFSIVSAHILVTNTLVDENGHSPEIGLPEQWKYLYYIIAIIVCCTFVAIPPLLLLDYPLRVLDWFVSKSRCLQRVYPTDKVHILMDAFQGCYKKNMRCFAGLYFLFRLFINTFSYHFLHTWPKQFMVQQMACILLITLIAICQPYQRKFLNYVDILIFSNLAIINGLTHYLYEITKGREKYSSLPITFAIEYVLVFLPLIYMLAYIIWRKTERYHARIKRAFLDRLPKWCFFTRGHQQLDFIVRDNLSVTDDPSTTLENTLDVILERSRDHNRYRSKVPVTVVGFTDEDRETDDESGEDAQLLHNSTGSSGYVPIGTNSTAVSDDIANTDSGYRGAQY